MSQIVTYKRRVFLDTNLLINEFYYRVKGVQEKPNQEAAQAITYLAKQPGVLLYIASFSVVQVISTLSKKGNQRRFGQPVTKDEITTEVARLLKTYQIISFGSPDMTQAMGRPYTDIEDAFQYQLCLKAGCYYLITDDKTGFRSLIHVRVVKPRRVRSILFQ